MIEEEGPVEPGIYTAVEGGIRWNVPSGCQLSHSLTKERWEITWPSGRVTWAREGFVRVG